MLFVTAANDRYFDFLLAQIVAVDDCIHWGYPIVYDLGMTQTQRNVLRIMDVKLHNTPPSPSPGAGYPRGYVPRSLYKPLMLLDACDRYDKPIVYLDADAKPLQYFEFPECELGLTQVDRNISLDYSTDDYGLREYVGPYHSGVIFLGKSEKRMKFLLAWARDLWSDPLPSDKKSLNRVVKKNVLELTVLDEKVYNAKSTMPGAKIYHYQGPIEGR